MVKDFQRLWEDVTGADDEAGAVRALVEILINSKEGRAFISSLKREDAVFCIEILDRGIVGSCLKAVEKQAFFVTLRRLAAIHGRLPVPMMISENIEVEDRVFASGGFSDVRIGRYMEHPVAVKTLRVTLDDDFSKLRKNFCKEVILWSTLSHPHVSRLIGVYGDMGKGQFTTIFEWMVHGTIMEYIRWQHVNRLELLHGAAQGLRYIHDAGLAHGDIKGANILVSNHVPPRACLADFGCMMEVMDPSQPISCSAQLESGKMLFMSPEILAQKIGAENATATHESDIYAFGWTILQVLIGGIPGYESGFTGYILSVIKGLRPSKPANAAAIGISDSLWAFVQCCWDGDKGSRPRVAEVVTHLAEAAANWQPPCAKSGESPTIDYSAIFARPPSVAPESPTDPRTPSEPYSCPGSPSPVFTESPQEGPRESTANLPMGRQLQELADDLPLSIYNMVPGSSLSVRSLEHSIEISAVLTPPGGIGLDEFVPSYNPSSLRLAEINAECQEEFIDKLDMTLEYATCDQERHELLNILCKMCSRLRVLPKSMHVAGHLSGELVEVERGGQATIFQTYHSNRPVAVKTMRVTMSSDFNKCRSEFCREAVAWRHLRHPNILPLLGVDLEQNRLSMISEWMDQGNINEYVKEHEGVNRLQLLVEVATGLEYMHSLNMVHGDLKGANILINQNHRACLADFGLSTIVSAEHNTGANASLISVASKASLMSFTAGGTFRWISPELLDPERFGASDDRPTKNSDCYALGMVVHEVLSGNSPFWNIKNEAILIHAITEGYRPKKPDRAESLGFTKELWKSIQRCWLADASARPDVRTILSHLNHATWSWERRWPV